MNGGTGADVCQAMAAAAARWADHAALRHRGETLTFRELWDAAEAAASVLRPHWAMAVAPGRVPRVGLLCPNGVAHVVLGLAVLRAGGCLVPVPLELAGPERDGLVQRTQLDGVIAADGGVWEGWTGNRIELAAGQLAFEWLGCESAATPGTFDALRPAFVRFSSGTTGASKGVVLSHASLLERVASANRRLQLGPKDRVLWLLPMAHHFAVTIVLYLLNGVTTLIEDSHLASDVLTAAREGGATVIYGSPFHHALLAAEGSGRDWPTLRLAVSTAARLEDRVASAFLARYGVPLTQGLGIIEVGLPLLNTGVAAEKPGSVGSPDDIAVEVRHENGTPCGAGEPGELWLKGPGMFDAYLDPWRTREEVTRDGWFATGDIAARDPDGAVWLKGRVKSVINVGGMKCFPEEIETVIDAHPAVGVSRVTGEPHARWGAIPVAEFEVRPGWAAPTAAALASHCRAALAAYKVPVRFKEVARVPRTASGKVSRVA